MKRSTKSGVVFSSEDSADTDHSMNSSIGLNDDVYERGITLMVEVV